MSGIFTTPWINFGHNSNGKRFVTDTNGKTVAELPNGSKENAALIAAAPELLAALEAVLEAWSEDRTHNRRKWNVRRDSHMMNVEACAWKVISQAKGE